ncbi:hypothetical protein AMTRI_Chr06g192330 [Amborella trichopoda]
MKLVVEINSHLEFIYCGTLSTSTPELLMNLMVIANKFDVVSCICQCSLLLSSFPKTPACASQYLEFPYKTLDAAQFFTDAAKQCLAEHQCEFFKYAFSLSCMYKDEELISLSLPAIAQLLSKPLLPSEDEVFNFALRWARAKYLELQGRREILGSELIPLIRFPYLTKHMLKEIRK